MTYVPNESERRVIAWLRYLEIVRNIQTRSIELWEEGFGK
jgi:hypothetical protein